MRLVELKLNKGGWPPSIIQGIVSGTKRITIHAVKAFDVSDGVGHSYSWKLTNSQITFLESLIKAEAKAN